MQGTRGLLLLIICITYWPLLTADFTNWDDQATLVNNHWLNPPRLEYFADFWNPRHPFMDIWTPMTYTVWSAVAKLAFVPTPDPETHATLNPWVFHGANLLVHVLSTLLVFEIVRRLIGKMWPAAAAAALFALHPVQVEPVGWLSGMKDLLCGCFGLLAVHQYLAFAAADEESRQRLWHYLAASASALAAMLAKPSGVVVPLVVAVIDLAILRRPVKSVFRAIFPWMVLTALFVLEGRFAQPPHSHRYVTPILERPFVAADALAFYLYKLFSPIHLAITYSRPPWLVLQKHWAYVTWIAPVTVAILLWIWRRRVPWLIGAVGVYWVAVLPVLGFVPFDFQDFSTVADHYLYLAMLGPAIALGFLLSKFARKSLIAPCALMLIALAARSWMQCWTWRDSVALHSNAIAVSPADCTGYNNLAAAYHDRHRYDDEVRIISQGLAHAPNCPPLHLNLAPLLANMGRLDEAEQHFLIAGRFAEGDDKIKVRDGLTKIAQMRRERDEERKAALTRPAK